MVPLTYQWRHFNCLFDVIYLQMDAACFLLFEYHNSSVYSIHIARRKLLIIELIMLWRYRFKPCSVAEAPVTGRMQQSTRMHCVIHSARQGLCGFIPVVSQKQGSSALSRAARGSLSLAVGGQQLLAQESPHLLSVPAGETQPARAVSLPAFCPWLSADCPFSYSLTKSPLLHDK